MQISYNQNRTEIRSINSMYDIYMNRGKIGNPPILLVYTDNTINVSDDEKTENEINTYFRNNQALTSADGKQGIGGAISSSGNSLINIIGSEFVENTVLASKDADKLSENVRSLFDIKLSQSGSTVCNKSDSVTAINNSNNFEESVTDYMNKILKDKSEFQVSAIASCFAAARKGNKKDVLAQESYQFYRLMKKKSEDCGNV